MGKLQRSRYISAILLLAWTIGVPSGFSQSGPEQAGTTPASPPAKPANEDPFADLDETPEQGGTELQRSWRESFFGENFGFRKEIMSQFTIDQNGDPASRQSIGFEVLKKFSTSTSTLASFNFQGRLVRRDRFNPVLNDMEGENRRGWAFEYHNLYVDLYNVLNPVLSDSQRGKNVGRFNVRAGRFYVPFGLNLQTDTHGTVLQLSNDRNFGFERDWYTGMWGALNRHLNYDAYYLAGSGYDLNFKGQRGLGALRISLSDRYSSQYGLETGVSILRGERLASMMEDTHRVPVIDTARSGFDARVRRTVPSGLVTLTTEVSQGRDDGNNIFTQLHQAEYVHSSRRWGVATQYRRFGQEGGRADASIIGEFSWYFRNDVGNSNLHWIKLNVEHQLERRYGPPSTIVTLQYYLYR
jgi:hypothetical protein